MGLEGVVNKGMELGEMAFNKVWLITDKCLAISSVGVFRLFKSPEPPVVAAP
ncbi:hypothetical protein SLEP1_g22461 [Rubroshorea leprosula]|uniref:Uncharacterized protein n=1 Tax=Rubroshorea leprosula TaxID=152421 RepID=A0AAV5JFC0_9ROSI|nr:hypothetical protein SLEP1_g22461 [Rubroshorea leprosula]